MRGLRTVLNRILASPMRRQLLVLLVIAQLMAHATTILVVSQMLNRSGQLDALREELIDGLSSALFILDPGQPDITAVFDRFVEHDIRYIWAESQYGAEDANPEITALVQGALPLVWQPLVMAYNAPASYFSPGPGGTPFVIVIDLGAGHSLQFTPSTNLIADSVPLVALTLFVLIVAVPLTVLTFWSGAYLMRPVERLSEGARQFSQGGKADPIAVTGPYEIRLAIESFNAMQSRVQALMDERQQTLASIGHDLRTPLTRLRLRLEAVALGDAAPGTERDIATMERLIDDALAFLRSEQHPVAKTQVKLTSLCETVVSDFVDHGYQVTLDGAFQRTVHCDVALMVRALTNIVENAIKYAGAAHVVLNEHANEIAVIDTGPGIERQMLEVVTQPFNRLDTVSSDTGVAPQGFGLGLSIAQSSMRRQGGDLRLEPNSPSGLIVRLRLPG